jgi:hypothetical protein
MSELFLTEEEVAELTGIKTGRRGKRREELQAEWMRTSGIPFWVNARGRPIIARAYFTGPHSEPMPRRKSVPQALTDQQTKKWQPDVYNNDSSLKEKKPWTLPTLKERRKQSSR